jgi:hypothetical protein
MERPGGDVITDDGYQYCVSGARKAGIYSDDAVVIGFYGRRHSRIFADADLGVAIPLALASFGAADWTKAAVSVLRVALLWTVMVLGLALVYRYAPSRERARCRWVTAGSLIAATLLLVASALFAFYVTNFAGYAKTYGALGGVVALLMWFFISSIVVVVGAQLNAEMERQTIKDTTVLRDAPMGQRGAFAADTVGPRAAPGQATTEKECGDQNRGSGQIRTGRTSGSGTLIANKHTKDGQRTPTMSAM